MIASARLYEWTPSLTAAWRRLLEWTAARARVHSTEKTGHSPGTPFS